MPAELKGTWYTTHTNGGDVWHAGFQGQTADWDAPDSGTFDLRLYSTYTDYPYDRTAPEKNPLLVNGNGAIESYRC